MNRCFWIMLLTIFVFGPALGMLPSQSNLLVAEKAGKVAFFLPEMHSGSPEQLGVYFKQIVKPAFARSSILLLEHAESPLLDKSLWYRGCNDEGEMEISIDDELNSRLHQVVSETVWRNENVPSNIDKLGRFIRFFAVLSHRLSSKDPGLQLGNNSVITVPTAPSSNLMSENEKPYRSVDSGESFLKAYCNLSVPERMELIKDVIALPVPMFVANPTKKLKSVDAKVFYIRYISNEYQQILTKIKEALAIDVTVKGASTKPENMGKVGENRFLIYRRNLIWMAQLPDVMKNERLPFYALGALHFLDGAYGSGLITLLRQAGYRVSLVKNRAQLKTILDALPAETPKPETAMSLINGKCIDMTNNYQCSWGDGSRLYLVNSNVPTIVTENSNAEERVTYCYKRPSPTGKQMRCIGNLVIPRAIDRKQDLFEAEKAAFE